LRAHLKRPQIILREASVFRLADNANRNSEPNFWQGSWPAIVRIIILEILLLAALTMAFVYYLNWSSEASVSEFMAASKASQQAVKDRLPSV
jgi:Tfp pilus assembly protein PilO